MADVLGGYQPDTRSESARRADFDLRRRIKRDGGGGGGGEGTPGPPGPAGPAGPAGPPGPGYDEVWIGPAPPSDEAIELWYDTDAVAPTVSSTQIIAVPYVDWPPVNPLADVLYLRIAPVTS